MKTRRIVRVTARALCVGAVGVSGVAALAGSPAGAAVRSAAQPPQATSVTLSVLHEVNAIRSQYGLSAAQLTSSYSNEVTPAASNNLDPALNVFGPGAVEEYGLWGIATAVGSSATPQPTTVVDNWVNEDGWQGADTQNLDCTSPGAPGCNGHRRAVLSKPPQPGDVLSVDVATLPTTFDGAPAISIAMLMVWGAPTSTTAAPATAQTAATAAVHSGVAQTAKRTVRGSAHHTPAPKRTR